MFCHNLQNIGFPMKGKLEEQNQLCDAAIAESTAM
jgi:hypothetical protein